MSITIFITGTDTNIGKTYVTAVLLRAFNSRGFSTIALKPLATGCFEECGKLYNTDALLLQQTSSIKLPYEKINPIALQPAIAPHLAADYLSVNYLTNCVGAPKAEICLIEGVGGWYVPLNEHETMADFVIDQQWPIILVIGIRLGCLNHALLTVQAMQHNGANLIGWIANCLDPEMACIDENIAALKKRLPRPCLGIVRFGDITL